MVVLAVMCEWLLTHCEVAGVLGWWCGCGIGCFLRLLSFGNIRCAAMCEWWLAHSGVGGCLAGGSGVGVAVFCGCWCLGVSVGWLCVSGCWHIADEVGCVVGWSVMCGRFLRCV